MDVTSIKAVIKDLQKNIIPSRFEKAQQPDNQTLQIGLRTLKGLTWIELCWNCESARLVEITTPPRIGTKSTLAQQIQYGLKDLALISINQKGFERIVEFHLALRPGDPIQKVLILELMGRYSNIFLLNEHKKIITIGRQIRSHQSRLRPVSTGDAYVSPPPLRGIPPNKEEPFYRWKERLTLLPINLKDALQQTYQGISPSLALQLVNEEKKSAEEILNLNAKNISSTLWKEIFFRWSTWLSQLDRKEPSLYFSGPTDFMHWSTEIKSYSEKNISRKLGDYYQENITTKKIIAISEKLNNNLKRLKTEEQKELKNQENLLSKTKENNTIKQEADKILCLKSPSKAKIEEAQKLYKKSKKLKRSASLIKQRIDHHDQKIQNIEESIDFLSRLLSNQFENKNKKLYRLLELKSELEEYLIKPKKFSLKSKIEKQNLSQHLEVLTPNGAIIQIGRNHRQNEFISIKKARKGDLWFHAQESPGSHVVLKASVKSCYEDDIQIAADLAALFSRAKGNKITPVIMAKIETLQRIQGALPGTVRHRNAKVLWGESERAVKHISTEVSLNELSS